MGIGDILHIFTFMENDKTFHLEGNSRVRSSFLTHTILGQSCRPIKCLCGSVADSSFLATRSLRSLDGPQYHLPELPRWNSTASECYALFHWAGPGETKENSGFTGQAGQAPVEPPEGSRFNGAGTDKRGQKTDNSFYHLSDSTGDKPWARVGTEQGTL